MQPEDRWSADGWDVILFDEVMFFQPPMFEGEGIGVVLFYKWKKGREFSTSVSATRGYCSVRGESFLSPNHQIRFEALMSKTSEDDDSNPMWGRTRCSSWRMIDMCDFKVSPQWIKGIYNSSG